MKQWARLLMVVGLMGCASSGQVKTDFNQKTDFSKFKTYAFLDMKDLEGSGVLSNSLVRQRVETLLQEQLDAKGLKKVTKEENPDMLIQYWVGVKEKQDVVSTPTSPSSYGHYYYDHWVASYDRYVTYDYREGTLIVDLIDRETKDLAWRAYLVQVLEDNKDKNMNTARKSLEKAFANYPPK